MDAEVVAEAFRRQPDFDSAKLFIDPTGREVVYETERASDDAFSVAHAVIELSVPHFHADRTEVYTALDNNASVIVNGERYDLRRGQEFVIKPGQVHWVRASDPTNPAHIMVRCTPAWTPNDHHVVPVSAIIYGPSARA